MIDWSRLWPFSRKPAAAPECGLHVPLPPSQSLQGGWTRKGGTNSPQSQIQTRPPAPEAMRQAPPVLTEQAVDELRLNMIIRDNDPRMAGRPPLTINEITATHVIAKRESGAELKIAKSRIHTDGKARRSGWSVVR